MSSFLYLGKFCGATVRRVIKDLVVLPHTLLHVTKNTFGFLFSAWSQIGV